MEKIKIATIAIAMATSTSYATVPNVMPNPFQDSLKMNGVTEHTDVITGQKMVQIVIDYQSYTVTCRVSKNSGDLIHSQRIANLPSDFDRKGTYKAGGKPVKEYNPYDFTGALLQDLEVGNNYVRILDTTIRIKLSGSNKKATDDYMQKCKALK